MNETDIHQLTAMTDDIAGRLNQMVEAKEIEPWERGNILRYLQDVLGNLTAKYTRVKEGAMEAMGGYIIKTDIDIAMEKGREEGREEGLEKGREEGLEKGREEGLEKGLEKGREETREEEKVSGIQRAMKKLNYTLDKAMDFMDIPDEDRPRYKLLFNEGETEYNTSSFG